MVATMGGVTQTATAPIAERPPALSAPRGADERVWSWLAPADSWP